MSKSLRIAAELRAAIEEGTGLFRGVPEERTARRPAADKWCAREVVGHLIDSACNNHRRFIINQDAERLIVDPYEQNVWVARQQYSETPAAELVPMWSAYNAHLARVIQAMPEDVLGRGRGPMGSHRFPYSGLPTADVVTLGHLVQDYVGHIRHHLEQVKELLA